MFVCHPARQASHADRSDFAYQIDVQNAADVSAAFSFSRTTGIPLSIKNTGVR